MLFLLLGGLVFVISRATDEGDKTAKVKTEADDGGATAAGDGARRACAAAPATPGSRRE